MSTQKNQQQKAAQKFLQRVIAGAFIIQAVIIVVNGNLDVLSGKPTLDVIQGMIVQGIELILKANRSRKSFEESDRTPQNPDERPNNRPDNRPDD